MLSSPIARTLTLALSLSLTGCSGCPPKDDPSKPPREEGGAEEEGQQEEEGTTSQENPSPGCPLPEGSQVDSCDTGRQIQLGSCQTADKSWSAEQRDGAVPYCVYTLAPGGDENAAPPLGSSPDCLVRPSSEPTQRWEVPFDKGVDIVDPTGLQTASWAPVTVTVIDTASTDATLGTATHGRAMAAIVRDVSGGCLDTNSSAECTRRVETIAGLPRSYAAGKLSSPDLVHGGYLGYTSDVADALLEFLDGCPENCRHSIINLSLGWDSGGKGIAAPVIYELLERASCRGALVVAAGGNRSPLQCSDVDLEPARWETEAAPDKRRCKMLGEPYYEYPAAELAHSGGTYRPLVHSISGARHDHSGLITASPQSQSRTAAIGYQAVVSMDGTTSTTNLVGPISGTSVSAAVVSGIASLVWSAEPDLTAGEVMDTIWSAGRPRESVKVERYLSTSTGAPQQRLVSACASLRSVCPSCTLQCGGQPFEVPPSSGGVGDAPVVSIDHSGEPQYQCPGCSPDMFMPLTGNMPTMDLVAGPQPGEPPCPPCWIDEAMPDGGQLGGNASLHLELSSSYANLDVTGFLVTLTAANGTREGHYYLNVPGVLEPGTTHVISDPALYDVDGQPPVSGWIEVYFQDNNGAHFSEGNELPIED